MHSMKLRRGRAIAGHLAGAALLVSAAAAFAVPALAKDAAPDHPAVASTKPLTSLARLQLEAAAGRAATINGGEDAFDRLSAAPDDPQAVIRGLNPRQRALVSGILGQSVQFAAMTGDQGVVAWFDLFTGTWLISDWTRTGQNWRMTRLGATSSEALAKTNIDKPWYRRAATLSDAIRQQARDAHTIFSTIVSTGGAERLITDSAVSRATLIAAITRAEGGDDRLAELQRRPAYAHYSKALTDIFLTHTQQVQAPPELKKAIGSLSGAERLSLRTIDSFERPDGQTFTVQSPLAPALVFVIDYKASDAVSPALPVRIETINLLEQVR